MGKQVNNTPPSKSGSSTNLTTKRFYLRVELKNEIEERADANYSGNASQLIRAAIHDHFSTLDGDSDRQAAHLTQEVSDLREQVQVISEAVQEDDQEGSLKPSRATSSQRDESDSVSSGEQVDSDESGSLQSEIYSALEDTESDSLTLAEITEETAGSLAEVASNAEKLTERGILELEQDGEAHNYSINT